MSASESAFPDFGTPSAARMYDYLLGGKNNSPADRELAKRVIATYPEVRKLARENRRFLTRAVWYLAEHGITQYVDLGCGMPTSPTVHEIARQVRPDARVIYVDNDPIAADHFDSVCSDDDGLVFLEYDIREPQEILRDWQLEMTIDLTVPTAFLCAAALHFIPDEDDPNDIVAALRWRMTSGSYLVLSHALVDDSSGKETPAIADLAPEKAMCPIPRTAEQIREFFSGLCLIEPGLTDVSQWRADESKGAARVRFLAGVGRKMHD